MPLLRGKHRVRASGLLVALVLALVLLLIGVNIAIPFSVAGALGGQTSVPDRGSAPSAATDSSDWPTYLGEVTRNSANPEESTLSSSNVAQLTQVWTYPIGAGNPGYLQAEPVEVDNTVYVGGGNGFFYALNATTGSLVWKSPNLGTDAKPGKGTCNYPDGITSSATVVNGDVYVGGGAGTFYALHQSDGTVDWSYQVGSVANGYYIWGSPLVLPSLGYAYIGVSSNCDNPLVDGGLDQISLSSHLLVHFFNDLSPSQQASCAANQTSGECGGSIWGTPAYDAATNTVWAATGNGYNLSVPEYGDSLMEWNASTLQLLNHWTLPTAQEESDGDFGTTPTLVNPSGGPTMVFATNKDGWSFAFNRNNISNGPVWQYRVSYSRNTVTPDAYGGGLIYVGGHSTNIGGKTYFGSIRAFDPDVNQTVWQLGLPGEVYGAPNYANGILVLVTGNISSTGNVSAVGNLLDVLNASTGKVLYSYQAQAPFLAAPSIAYGRIYVENMGGSVLAFGLPGSASKYPLTFQETGIVGGAQWGVTVAGSAKTTTSTSLTFQLLNGTYSYTVSPPAGYTVVPSSGSVTISGAPATIDLTFTQSSPPTYNVTFSQPTGHTLPSGTTWSVTLNGTTHSSSSTSIKFSALPNGNYPFAVGAIPGFTASPSSGTISVSGADVNQPIQWSEVTYNVTFSQPTGHALPTGTTWDVTLNGTTHSSSTTRITFAGIPNGSYPFQVGAVPGFTASPSSGTIQVQGAAVNESIAWTALTYLVTVQETGFGATPPEWWFNVTSPGGSSHSSTGTSLSLSLPNGTYTYVLTSTDARWAPVPYGGTFTVNGAPMIVNVTFVEQNQSVTFVESNLPSGTEWWVNVSGGFSNSSSVGSVGYQLPNGTYTYTATSANRTWWAPEGNFTVDGAPLTISVNFSNVLYLVSFNETGLASGTVWSVTLAGVTGGSTGPSVSFMVPNGTYNYQVAGVAGYVTVSSGPGSVTVSGAPVSESIVFAANYTVTFTESGALNGSAWQVTLAGVAKSTTSTSIVFSETNGSYSFTASAAGFTATPAAGTVNVSGAPVTVPISFSAVPPTRYAVSFDASGLPAGTAWSVTFGGMLESSSLNTITFEAQNGNYTYTVGAPSGYVAAPPSGSVNIQDAGTVISISFASHSPPPSNGNGSSTFLGLPGNEGYWLVGGALAVVVLAAIALALVGRRKRRTPPPAPPSPPS